MKHKIVTVINYFNLYSALLLTASSIYYYNIQRWPFVLFFASYLFEFILEKKWENIPFTKARTFYVVMAFFFLLAFVYYPFDTSKYFHWLLDRRFALFGFAAVGFFGVNNKFKLSYFLNTFIISSIISIAYLVFIRIGILEFFKDPQRFVVFNLKRIEFVNMHRIFNLYLNVALIGIWYILTRSWKRTIWLKRLLYLGSLMIIFSALSVSEGRTGLVASLILIISFFFYETLKRKKIIGYLISFFVLILMIFVGVNQKRMSEKMVETEPRWFLWESAFSVIKDKPVFGHGISNAQEEFDVARTKFQTEEYRLTWIKSKLLDSHNQFLQTTMEFGVFGFLILLFLYLYPIAIADNKRKLFSMFLIFLCINQSMFDTFITGTFASIFGFMMLMTLSIENDIDIDTTKKIT